MKAQTGWSFSFILCFTSALDGVRWSTPRSDRFTPSKKTRGQLNRSLGGPRGRYGQVLKISPPRGFET